MGTKSHGTSMDSKKKNVGSQNRRKVSLRSKKQQFWHTVRTVVVVSAVLCYEKKNCIAAAKVKFWKIHRSSGNIQ